MANPEQPGSQSPQTRKPHDAGDPESVGEQKREKNAREARKALAFSKLLTDAAGREWLWDLMTDCYLFHTTFTGNAEGYFREGKRNIGLQLLAQIMRAHPDHFATMMKENAK